MMKNVCDEYAEDGDTTSDLLYNITPDSIYTFCTSYAFSSMHRGASSITYRSSLSLFRLDRSIAISQFCYRQRLVDHNC